MSAHESSGDREAADNAGNGLDQVADRQNPPSHSPPQSFVNLGDSVFFPLYSELPVADNFDLRYYKKKGFVYELRHHWCFLGEIDRINDCPWLAVSVEDSSGYWVQVILRTEEAEKLELEPQLKIGHTVAVMYAHQHKPLMGDSSTLVAEPKHFQVRLTWSFFLLLTPSQGVSNRTRRAAGVKRRYRYLLKPDKRCWTLSWMS